MPFTSTALRALLSEYQVQLSVLNSMLRLVRRCQVVPTRRPTVSASLRHEIMPDSCGSTFALVSEYVPSAVTKPDQAGRSSGRRVFRITVPPMPPSSIRASGVLYSSALDSMFDGRST